MRVSTKITAAFALFFLLFAGVLAYQLSLIKSLVAINRDLTSINFQATKLSRSLIQLVGELWENTRKYNATKDDIYATLWSEASDKFDARLAELSALETDPREERAVALLAQTWSVVRGSPILRAGPPVAAAEGLSEQQRLRIKEADDAVLEARRRQFSALTQLAEAVVGETSQTIERRAELADFKSLEAGRIAGQVVLGALGLILAVSILTTRSIKVPLRRFTAGARAVAEGKFSYQLDETSGDEFAPPAAAFNSMAQRLGDLDRLKRDFLAHVSHELKTPIVSMQETNALLLDQLAGPLNAKQRRIVSLNLDGARRLSAMISNLLDLSRMEAGALEYEFIESDFVDLVELVVEELEGRVREKGLWLEADLSARPLVIHGDRDHLIQVIENLYENAVKFSAIASTLSLALSTVEAPPDHLPMRWRRRLDRCGFSRFALLAVSDSGPGVPDKHKEKIFEKFHQVEKSQKKGVKSGVGLGLAISREIVEAHHGAIWVTDNPSTGSTFYLLLPVDPRIPVVAEGPVEGAQWTSYEPLSSY